MSCIANFAALVINNLVFMRYVRDPKDASRPKHKIKRLGTIFYYSNRLSGCSTISLLGPSPIARQPTASDEHVCESEPNDQHSGLRALSVEFSVEDNVLRRCDSAIAKIYVKKRNTNIHAAWYSVILKLSSLSHLY